jgi:signal transduction histidine kinase
MQFQDVDFKAVIEQAIESVTPIAEEKFVHLAAKVSDAPAIGVGDPVRLLQLFTNLLTNAIKFTPENGEVVITLHSTSGSIQVQVKDNGIGIEADFLPRVFEPFAQEDSSSTRTYSGLGLGLAIVRRLTEMHNGSIDVESAGRGKGTTFTLHFPARPAGEQPLPANGP